MVAIHTHLSVLSVALPLPTAMGIDQNCTHKIILLTMYNLDYGSTYEHITHFTLGPGYHLTLVRPEV